ncbi:MAG: polyphosphate kinase 1 [Chloroherpetonaceae bacterium]|nr:polyphosphate kinase 1 [Chloroherpetonaceae bacterium]
MIEKGKRKRTITQKQVAGENTFVEDNEERNTTILDNGSENAVDSKVERNSNDHPYPVSHELYLNRELSWLEFNRRVLEEAKRETNPLLERVKFISIFGSNFDEFFMIRVSGLEEQLSAGIQLPSLDGLTPFEQLSFVRERVIEMMSEARNMLYDELLPKLQNSGIIFRHCNELSKEKREDLNRFFDEQIFPVLTPLAFDPGHPFPHVSNLSISLAVELLGDDGQPRFARLKVPNTLNRLIRLDRLNTKPQRKNKDKEPEKIEMVWLEDVIQHNLQKLFPGVTILSAYPFRVIRDADIEIEEDEAGDLLETIEAGIRQRKYGEVVRLDINPGLSEGMKAILMENLGVEERHIYSLRGALGLSSLIELMEIDRPELKDQSFVPRNPFIDESESFFTQIAKQDILLHHPYDSFQPIVDLVSKASDDPAVVAIKQSLYRVGSKSPVVQRLIEAAGRDKQVAVLVELKARFDEENNIIWAKALESAGVHVVYGLIGLKTHAKMLLIVRREEDGSLKRYVHLGTGNYNASTAKIYTDYSFLTADSEIAADVSDLFNFLTGYSKQKNYRKLLVAPHNIRVGILEKIRREIAVHKALGGGGRIIFKMNALTDASVINALYEASEAGVKIDLIIRGICVLKPEIKGFSENIRVISIVGRFLEHSRVYFFHNGGKEEIYLGSADMMGRNLDRRVETLFPIESTKLQKSLKKHLDEMLKDDTNAWILDGNGRYHRIMSIDQHHYCSQLKFLEVSQRSRK